MARNNRRMEADNDLTDNKDALDAPEVNDSANPVEAALEELAPFTSPTDIQLILAGYQRQGLPENSPEMIALRIHADKLQTQ